MFDQMYSSHFKLNQKYNLLLLFIEMNLLKNYLSLVSDLISLISEICISKQRERQPCWIKYSREKNEFLPFIWPFMLLFIMCCRLICLYAYCTFAYLKIRLLFNCWIQFSRLDFKMPFQSHFQYTESSTQSTSLPLVTGDAAIFRPITAPL